MEATRTLLDTCILLYTCIDSIHAYFVMELEQLAYISVFFFFNINIILTIVWKSC